jgi:hypothetical protein
VDSPDRDVEPVGWHLGLYKNLFNWTMTFRLDSDIFRPYANVVPMVNITFDKEGAIQRFRLVTMAFISNFQ